MAVKTQYFPGFYISDSISTVAWPVAKTIAREKFKIHWSDVWNMGEVEIQRKISFCMFYLKKFLNTMWWMGTYGKIQIYSDSGKR